MTRILVVSNLYPPHALGGYEWSCHDVMRRLQHRGDEVEVLTTDTRLDGVVERRGDPDVPVHRVLEWYWDDHELRSPPILERYRMERRNRRHLRAALSRFRPDVVSVWNIGAMSLGLVRTVAAAGVPMVFAVCDEWPIHGPLLDAWGRIFLRRPRLARAAEALLRVPCVPTDLGPTGAWCFVSQHTMASCLARSSFSFPRRGVVHSGIEASDFPAVDPASEDRPFRWRLLCVGRLDERKGVLTAVDALALLPEQATLTFVGRGDARRAILDRAAALGLSDRIEITAADRGALASHYRDADAFLFTSEWDEPFGLTPIEAMACGTPVVGTGSGGSGAFLVDGVNCLRYPPADGAGLAAAVNRLAADVELRRRIRRGGAVLAAALTTDRLADVFAEWHDAAAAGFPTGPPAHRPLPVPDAPC